MEVQVPASRGAPAPLRWILSLSVPVSRFPSGGEGEKEEKEEKKDAASAVFSSPSTLSLPDDLPTENSSPADPIGYGISWSVHGMTRPAKHGVPGRMVLARGHNC